MEASQLSGYYAKYSFASFTGKFMNTNIIHSLKEINNSILMLGGAGKKISKQSWKITFITTIPSK